MRIVLYKRPYIKRNGRVEFYVPKEYWQWFERDKIYKVIIEGPIEQPPEEQ